MKFLAMYLFRRDRSETTRDQTTAATKRQPGNLSTSESPINLTDPASGIFSKAFFVRFPIKEQVHFAKRLSFLIAAGVSLPDSMKLLHSQASDGAGKQCIYEQIITDLNNGQSLSGSLTRFERFFGSFAINIIRVGEMGGVLSENLEYLASELRKEEELRKKIVSALIYPIFIATTTLLLSGLLTVFIFPKVMPIFRSLDVELPLTTVTLLTISNFLADYGLRLIVGVVVFFILFRLAQLYSPVVRFWLDSLSLQLPIFGPVLKYYNLANFCRTLGLLLKSGINVVDAVKITGETMGNLVYQRECDRIAAVVMRGERISAYLSKHPHYFPDFTTHLIAIGETTGSLADSLGYLSDMYESEVADLTKNLSSAIEPILMIFMGLIVGLVAVSVITPIYEVTQHLNP